MSSPEETRRTRPATPRSSSWACKPLRLETCAGRRFAVKRQVLRTLPWRRASAKPRRPSDNMGRIGRSQPPGAAVMATQNTHQGPKRSALDEPGPETLKAERARQAVLRPITACHAIRCILLILLCRDFCQTSEPRQGRWIQTLHFLDELDNRHVAKIRQ